MELETNNMTPGIGRESVLSTVEPVAADTSLNEELDSLVQNEQQLSVLLSQASVLDGADFYVTDEQFSGNDFTLVAAPEFSYQSRHVSDGASYLPDFVEPFIPFESRRRYDHSVYYIYQLLADFMILLGVVGSSSSSRRHLDFDWSLLCAREDETSISFRLWRMFVEKMVSYLKLMIFVCGPLSIHVLIASLLAYLLGVHVFSSLYAGR